MFTVGRDSQQFERFLPTHVVDPVLDAQQFLGFGFVQAPRRLPRSFSFRRRRAAGPCRQSLRWPGRCRPAETSVASASTRCHAGLSTRALLLECRSCLGPRPHFSPLEISSSSTTPLAPRYMVTSPSRALRRQWA